MGMVLGRLLQLIFPFLTQAMVDVGIGNRDFNHIFIAARAVVEGNMTLG
jgi:ATP-binding cassette subfamily B protein